VVVLFVSSAFVPTASMPAGLRWFAEYQPFTPVSKTLRGLLAGGGIGWAGVVALGWCGGLAVVGYLWSRALYERDQPPRP
jgi:ABC-2 type transport system permease protein